MRTDLQIHKALDQVKKNTTNYTCMTYEQGIQDALEWVLGLLSDERFDFSHKD